MLRSFREAFVIDFDILVMPRGYDFNGLESTTRIIDWQIRVFFPPSEPFWLSVRYRAGWKSRGTLLFLPVVIDQTRGGGVGGVGDIGGSW